MTIISRYPNNESIVERAENYVKGIDSDIRVESKKSGYIKGSTDQLDLDCKWLINNLGSYIGEGGWSIFPREDEEDLSGPEIVAKHL